MRSEAPSEKSASSQFGSSSNDQNPNVNAGKPGTTRIPFRIGDGMAIRSSTDSTCIANSRIVGAVHGKYILLTEPTVKINERIPVVLNESIKCAYFDDGILYSFNSKYRQHLVYGIVCIDYPQKVEVRQVRKHRRIKVNIETEYSISGAVGSFVADMTDISCGGCRLISSRRVPLTKGTRLSLAFNLHNEAMVSGLEALSARINHTAEGKGTEIGLSFIGPPDELAKIANFCEFCMYFDLE